MDQFLVVPEPWADRARRFAAGGIAAVPARPAATVALLRDGASGLEVFLLRRARTMAFAGGMYAFPGGKLEPGEDAAGAAVREVYEETGVRLAPDDLAAWAHWITPIFEERRYDTRFFVAALPPGEDARNISREATETVWARPAAALDRLRRGEILMLPPTAVTLVELSDYIAVREAISDAASRVISPITPQAVVDDTMVRLALPGDPAWRD